MCRSIVALSLCTCLLGVHAATLAAVEKTVVRDRDAARALVGQHRFSLQWISTQKFGMVTITEDRDLFRIEGHQTDQGTSAVDGARSAMTIDGVLVAIDSTGFEFEGEIMIRLGYGPGKEPCVRRGTFTFGYREKRSRSWRLQDRRNPCVDHVDYVDVYVDRDWRPAIAEPRVPTETERWGIGVITGTPDTGGMPGAAIFPDAPVPLHAEPGGPQTGTARRADDTWRVLIEPAGTHASPADLREVGYESGAVIVFEEKDDHLNVFRHSTDQGTWIRGRDLATQGFRFVRWVDFLRERSDGGLFPRPPTAVNLRAAAGPAGARLSTLRGTMIDITPTGRGEGAWLEVDVIRYDVHPCEDGQGHVAERWKGWLKAVDDEGYPNLWYPTRGC